MNITRVVLSASMLCAGLCAGDFSSYRGLQFGMTLAAAAKQGGARLADARLVHQRPAVIQEMDWEPRLLPAVDPANADPVKDAVLCFFNGELFRIVVTYDRNKIEGMTVADMIEAISAKYGVAANPKVEIAFHSNYGESAPVLARWGSPEYSYDLVRTGDQAGFAMVLYSKRVDALAQTSIVEAVRLEALDAPQREIDKQQKRETEERLLLEKARLLNKPNFRP